MYESHSIMCSNSIKSFSSVFSISIMDEFISNKCTTICLAEHNTSVLMRIICNSNIYFSFVHFFPNHLFVWIAFVLQILFWVKRNKRCAFTKKKITYEYHQPESLLGGFFLPPVLTVMYLFFRITQRTQRRFV